MVVPVGAFEMPADSGAVSKGLRFGSQPDVVQKQGATTASTNTEPVLHQKSDASCIEASSARAAAG